MISNNQSKIIKSLQLKKYRKLHSSFFVEGRLNVLEVLKSNLKIKHLFITENAENEVRDLIHEQVQLSFVTEKELEKVGTFKSNNFGLVIVEMADDEVVYDENEWCIALDGINDPGNLGTIIRTADWFGIKTIYCSLDSVDVYNPKVLNSTKGSFSRLNVKYVDLNIFLKNKVVVTAEMEGENLYDYNWGSGGVLIMGNESHGVSKDISQLCTSKITIPSFGQAESLNVGVATAIICSDIASKLHLK
jgi:RNA methyltransferase, TrmH family